MRDHAKFLQYIFAMVAIIAGLYSLGLAYLFMHGISFAIWHMISVLIMVAAIVSSIKFRRMDARDTDPYPTSSPKPRHFSLADEEPPAIFGEWSRTKKFR